MTKTKETQLPAKHKTGARRGILASMDGIKRQLETYTHALCPACGGKVLISLSACPVCLHSQRVPGQWRSLVPIQEQASWLDEPGYSA
jgi:hypothetical protein